MFPRKPVPRQTRLARAKNLLKFHCWLVGCLVTARACGSIQTTNTYRAQLLVNARVLRSKLLGA